MATVVTTRRRPRAFAWSYSKLKNWRVCPRRHYHVDVKRDFAEEESDALLMGNVTHKVIAERIEAGTALPETQSYRDLLEGWARKILQGHLDARAYADATGGKILVEQKIAITKDFGPCEYFDKNIDPWFRGVADVLKMNGPVALIVDWKTGKVIEESEQLFLLAACVFAHYPHIQRVRSMFVWLKEDAETMADYSRADLPGGWAHLLRDVQLLEKAYADEVFPPKPSFLCRKWCPVRTCKHYGESM